MLDTILSWFAKMFLNWLLQTVQTQLATAKEEAEQKAKDEKTDAENVAKYQAAQDRAAKIKAATDLLNGTAS